MSLLNWGAGLSAAGTAVAGLAGTAAMAQQKSDLEKEQAVLADQLATTREHAGRVEAGDIAATAAQKVADQPLWEDAEPGHTKTAVDRRTGQPLPGVAPISGGAPTTPLGNTLLAQGVKQGSPEWNDAMKAEAAREMGKDPLSQAHLTEAQASADLSKSRLEQLKSGQLDDDAIEFRSHLAAAGDPSAYQGIPKSIYGSVSIAKIGNRAAALAKESAETEGLSPEEAGRRQAQINIQFNGAKKAYGAIAQAGAQKDQVAIEMGKLGDQMADASKAVQRSGWTDLNTIGNYAKSHASNPEYGQLAVAVQGFKTAYAQALVRGGTATDAARAHADDLFSTARNDEDLMARVRQAQKEIGAVLESTSETKTNVLSGVGGGGAAVPKSPAAAGSAAPAGAPAGAQNAPKGIDPTVWSHMTPEERKLFQ